jgi:hypothetical protein
MIPENFDGTIYPLRNTSTSDSENYYLNFYRRETDKGDAREFLKSIESGNMAWDAVTRKMYYRDENGQLYRMNFVKVKSL